MTKYRRRVMVNEPIMSILEPKRTSKTVNRAVTTIITNPILANTSNRRHPSAERGPKRVRSRGVKKSLMDGV
jgi:hypothetical protein